MYAYYFYYFSGSAPTHITLANPSLVIKVLQEFKLQTQC